MNFTSLLKFHFCAKSTLSTTFAFLCCAVLLGVTVEAQVSSGGRPMSRVHELRDVQHINTLMNVNIDSVLAQDKPDATGFKPFRIGAAIPFSVDFFRDGQWDSIPGIGKVCRMAIEVPEAKLICVNYSDFHLPKGSTFFVYHPTDTSEMRGAFTDANNQESGRFGTGFVRGSEIVLEYFEPSNSESARIKIGSVVHVFRGAGERYQNGSRKPTDKLLAYGDALPCNINIKCPEGLPFEAVSRSVVLITTDSQTIAASGALVNNVREDKEPYVLTAGHVYDADTDVSGWLFYFNYFQPLCDSLYDGSLNQSVQGISKRAYGSLASGSDFALIETEAIPASYDAYFAGWNNVDAAADSTLTIHHPMSDVKKISFDADTPVGSNYQYNTFGGSSTLSHWWVTFHPNSGTGIIQDGSSGAPLFDDNGRIVGQHSRGTWNSGTCTTSTQNSLFGKFARAWNYYSSSPSLQLKYWLDPDNTGATTLNGLDTRTACCVGSTGNYDDDPFESVDIGDLVYQINYLFNQGLAPACWDEGNCDGDSNNSIDIADLTLLVDHLFINFTPLADCP